MANMHIIIHVSGLFDLILSREWGDYRRGLLNPYTFMQRMTTLYSSLLHIYITVASLRLPTNKFPFLHVPEWSPASVTGF